MLVCMLTAALAAPSLVTTTKGDVDLVAGGRQTDAPAPPFLVAEGQSLALADGAMVVVLRGGAATQHLGPATIDPAKLAAPVAADAAVDELLGRNASTARAGATRAGEVLVVPVPGTRQLDLGAIRWRCAPCTDETVEIFDFADDGIVWTGRGSGSATYTGPTLAPGAWGLRVAGREYTVVIAPADEAERVRRAVAVADAAAERLKAAGTTDPATLVSVPGSLLLQAGMPTEALERVDAALAAHPGDAGLVALRDAWERQAGVGR